MSQHSYMGKFYIENLMVDSEHTERVTFIKTSNCCDLVEDNQVLYVSRTFALMFDEVSDPRLNRKDWVTGIDDWHPYYNHLEVVDSKLPIFDNMIEVTQNEWEMRFNQMLTLSSHRFIMSRDEVIKHYNSIGPI